MRTSKTLIAFAAAAVLLLLVIVWLLADARNARVSAERLEAARAALKRKEVLEEQRRLEVETAQAEAELEKLKKEQAAEGIIIP